jgi:hypothetical protein
MTLRQTTLLSLAVLTGCQGLADPPGEATAADRADSAPPPAWHELLPRTPLRVAAIGAGDAILAGELGVPIDLGGEHLVSTGGVDLFVSRMDGRGNHRWSRAFGAPGKETIASLAAGGEALVLAGTSEGGLDFGGGRLGAGAFVAKLDGAGRPLWSKAIGGATVPRVRMDDQGDVVALVKASEPVDLGDGPITSGGGTIVVKLGSEAGQTIWTRTYGPEVVMRDVAVSHLGEVVAVGSLVGRYDFGGGAIATEGRDHDAILVRYGRDGSFQWNRRYGDSDSQDARVVAADGADRNLFALLKEASGPVLGVHDYSGYGEPRWSFEVPGPTVLAADGAGGVLYATTSLTTGNNDLGRIDARGRLLWEWMLAPDYHSAIDDLTITTAGILLVVGHGADGTDLGGGVILRPAGGSTGFVAAYTLDS